MTIALITSSNLVGQGWQNIFDVVNNRTYIADPLSPGGGRKFVYTRMPNIKSPDFQGFPFIVLSHPTLSQDRKSVNAKRKFLTYNIMLIVYSSDRLQNGQVTGDGYKYLDQISNDVMEAFNSSTVKGLLRPFGVENLEVDLSDEGVDDVEEDVAFINTFTLTFGDKKDVF